MLPWEELSELIRELYISVTADKNVGYFGIILGPSGTGKTTIVSNLCKKYPEGVIYVEITEPLRFPTQLAARMGMRLGPSNMEDVLLGYLSTLDLCLA